MHSAGTLPSDNPAADPGQVVHGASAGLFIRSEWSSVDNLLLVRGYRARQRDAVRIRASDLAAIFEVYLLAIALGALKTALDLREPWFSGTATLWTYATTFVGSVILLSLLSVAAAVLVRPKAGGEAPEAALSEDRSAAVEPSARAEEEMEEILAFLKQGSPSGANPGEEPSGMAGAGGLSSRKARRSASASRATPNRRIRLALVGPAVTAAFFAGLSAAFLPGAEGYLQTFYTLNTFIVLFFSYGWAGLLAYSACSLFLAVAEA